MIKVSAIVLAGMLALGSCGDKPSPAPTWETGDIPPAATVKSKQLIRADSSNPNSEIVCYEIILEWRARTERYCTTKERWDRAQPGSLLIWN